MRIEAVAGNLVGQRDLPGSFDIASSTRKSAPQQLATVEVNLVAFLHPKISRSDFHISSFRRKEMATEYPTRVISPIPGY